MNKRLFSLVGAAIFCLAAQQTHAQDLHSTYEEGRAAYNSGQLELAREKLNIVAAANPSHVPTQAMLAQIRQALGEDNTKLRKSYDAVIIEKIEFDNVELSEALEALRILARKASNDKFTPNIIVTKPELGKQLVSINLTRVPLSEVLNYLAQLSGAKLTYDKTAVLLSSRAG